MAISMRRRNQWPTMAMLTTESALWPSARVRVTAIASSVNVVTRLINTTVRPSAAATQTRTALLPNRSRTRPMPTAPAAPASVAQRFSCA